MRADAASEATVAAALERRQFRLDLLRKGATFEQFRAAGGDTTELTADRWRFVLKNYTVDATEDLARVRIPVRLVLAGHDLNVDVAETEATYRTTLGGLAKLRVAHFPDASHSLVRNDIETSQVTTVTVALAAPRSLFAAGYLDTQREFVAGVDEGL